MDVVNGHINHRFIFETIIAIVESNFEDQLYPMFPYSRVALLIITVLATNYYIRKRTGIPKMKLSYRIGKYILLTIVFYALMIAGMFAISGS